jgi:hypothetical protein
MRTVENQLLGAPSPGALGVSIGQAFLRGLDIFLSQLLGCYAWRMLRWSRSVDVPVVPTLTWSESSLV